MRLQDNWSLAFLLCWVIVVLAVFALCEPARAAAGECEIILTGDLQNGTMCDNAAGATDSWESAFDWIIARDPPPALVYIPGDLVEGNQFHHVSGRDCYCMSLPLTGADCTNSVNPKGYACSTCNVARAVACDLGTPGWDCEFSRAKRWRDRVEADGIPIVVGPGNHCADWAEPDATMPGFSNYCVQEFHVFNSFFGEGLTTDNAIGAVRTTTPVVPCVDAADGFSTQATMKSLKFDCGGTTMKFIEVPYHTDGEPWRDEFPTTEVDLITSAATRAWVIAEIAADPKMPTILGSHAVIWDGAATGCGADGSYDYAWCTGSAYFQATWRGYAFHRDFNPHRNVLMNLSAHIRQNFHRLSSQASGRPLIGIAADHSYQWDDDYVGRPAWAVEANGGAGTLTIIHIDASRGVVSSRAYSPHFAERYGHFDDGDGPDPAEGTDWVVNLPMCADKTRFEFADGFCQEVAPPAFNGTKMR